MFPGKHRAVALPGSAVAEKQQHQEELEVLMLKGSQMAEEIRGVPGFLRQGNICGKKRIHKASLGGQV